MEKKKKNATYLIWIPVLVLFITIIFLSVHFFKPRTTWISGEVDARQIDISSKIAGRIDTIYVKEGNNVYKNQTLARLLSPEMQAKEDQAKSAIVSAKAMYDMALEGARTQDVQAAWDMYLAAKAQSDYAEKSYNRMKNLLTKQTISKQAFDEVEAKYLGAKAQTEAAHQKWDMANKGARTQEILAAKGNYERAVNTLKEVESYVNETIIRAPQAGEIDNVIVDPGEVISAGYPIISLVDLSDQWIVLYVPENKLSLFAKNAIIPVQITALNDLTIDTKVTFINPVADFSTKKATTEQGGFDLKTFEIHLTPVKPVPNLRPGMSAHVPISKEK